MFFVFTSISKPFPYLDLMCWGVPMHLKLPETIIPKRVDSASASSIEWVVKMTVDCFLSVEILLITFHMNLLALGSIPVEGSSRKIILGLPIMAIATDSFLLFPPDKVPESLCSYFSRFMSYIFLVMAKSLCFLGRHFMS